MGSGPRPQARQAPRQHLTGNRHQARTACGWRPVSSACWPASNGSLGPGESKRHGQPRLTQAWDCSQRCREHGGHQATTASACRRPLGRGWSLASGALQCEVQRWRNRARALARRSRAAACCTAGSSLHAASRSADSRIRPSCPRSPAAAARRRPTLISKGARAARSAPHCVACKASHRGWHDLFGSKPSSGSAPQPAPPATIATRRVGRRPDRPDAAQSRPITRVAWYEVRSM